jgi:uncharacterized protein YjbI with pentapeptide repeats
LGATHIDSLFEPLLAHLLLDLPNLGNATRDLRQTVAQSEDQTTHKHEPLSMTVPTPSDRPRASRSSEEVVTHIFAGIIFFFFALAVLVWADLRGAKLQCAELQDAQLQRADLRFDAGLLPLSQVAPRP